MNYLPWQAGARNIWGKISLYSLWLDCPSQMGARPPSPGHSDKREIFVMADKPLPWFRAYHESAFDPKFNIAASQTGLHSLTVFGAWWKLLCLAGASPVRGSLNVTELKRYSNGDVAGMLQISNDECEKLLQVFISLDMLEIDKKTKAYLIKNWDKRQPNSDSSTNRVRKYRQSNGNVTPTKRSSNVPVTRKDLDTEADTELDTEKEREGAKSAPPTPAGNLEPIAILKRITGKRSIPNALYESLCDTLTSKPDEEKLKACWVEWNARGYRPDNWAWALEWYKDGIPSKPNGNGRKSSAQNAADYLDARIKELENGNAS